MSICPGNERVLAGVSLYNRAGNIYGQFEGFLVNTHLEKVDIQSFALSLLGHLSNPKIAANFFWGIVLHKHQLNSSKASKS